MNNAIFTSNQPRHLYFINEIMKHVDIGLVVMEDKTPSQDLAKEQIFFGNIFPPPPPVLRIRSGEINGDVVLGAVSAIGIENAFVFGSSLIGKRLLSKVSSHCVNLHTGIVQKFRGVDSSFWALFEDLPEAIGSTIHLVDSGIDTGRVIRQSRPELEVADTPYQVFLKTCKNGTTEMVKVAQEISSGNTLKTAKIKPGSLYQNKDMSESAIKTVQSNCSKVISKYLLNKAIRDDNIGIIKG